MADIQFVIKLNRATVFKEVSVDELIGLQEGVIRTMRDVLARYAYNKETGEKLEPEEAVRVIGKHTVEELAEASDLFLKELENSAVPPK